VFEAAGLEGADYLLFGRRYHGEWGGRRVEVFYTPARGGTLPVLEIRVAAELGTRLAIASGIPLLDCRGCDLVEVIETETDRLELRAEDVGCGQALIADETTRELITRLLAGQTAQGLRELYLQPAQAWLRARPRSVDEVQAGRWYDDMLALTESVEMVLSPLDCASGEQ
jgi:hypothetical protein